MSPAIITHQGPDHLRTYRCQVCCQRITMSIWDPFCCQVCCDSNRAQVRRERELARFLRRKAAGR